MLARVPVKLAELHGIFPVLYDDKAGALSVVTADPDNDVALQEVKLSAAVREVRALAARPAAVRAAIGLHYRNDRAAFAALLRPVGFGELLNEDPFERKSSAGRARPIARAIDPGLAELPPSPPPPPPLPELAVQPLPPSARLPRGRGAGCPRLRPRRTRRARADPSRPPPVPVIKAPSLPPPRGAALAADRDARVHRDAQRAR